jgi:multidrug resistance efflux pump
MKNRSDSARRRVTAIGCALVFAVTLISFVAAAAVNAQTTASTTAPAATQPAAAQVVAIATVEALWSTDQYAKIAGYVAEVNADLGDHVKMGQVLATIDVPELEKELAAAKATVAAKRELANAAAAAIEQARTAVEVAKRQQAGATAELQLAEATLKRQEELFTGKAATSQQMDEARARAESARAASGVSQAKIAAAEADLKAATANESVAKANADVAAAEAERTAAIMAYTHVVAPFDAVVTRRGVSPGDLVQSASAGRGMPLFTVQQMDTVRVSCDVPEAGAVLVRAGDPAEVKFFGLGGKVIHGTVTRIAAAVDSGTRTMRAEINLPNAGGELRPGMYAQVTLTPSGKLADAPAATRTATASGGSPPAR